MIDSSFSHIPIPVTVRYSIISVGDVTEVDVYSKVNDARCTNQLETANTTNKQLFYQNGF